MVNINYVVIILTPFQQKAITNLFPDRINNKRTLILSGESIDDQIYIAHKEKIKSYNFSQKKIFKNPLKFTVPFRRNIKAIKNSMTLLQDKYNFSEDLVIYIGSDKDVFTQIFVGSLKNKTKSIVAVDEGLGYYVKEGAKDKLIQLIYFIITPFLFGFRLYYIKRLGTLRGIDTVYLRDPDLLAQRKKNIRYLKFNFTSNQNSRKISNGKILLFSFPSQHYMYPSDKKINLYRDISDYLSVNNRELIIKPHPREDVETLRIGLEDKKNVHLLKGNITGEMLDYFEYEIIINVFSSIILDIVSNSYPKKRVITLGFDKKPAIKLDGELQYIPIHCFKIEEHIEFET